MPLGPVSLEEVALAAFTVCNGLRLFAYIPQIHKAAVDKSGAAAISVMTWLLFLVSNTSTAVYAFVKIADWWLAACFTSNAICCALILAVTFHKRRSYSRRVHYASRLAARA